MDRLNQNENVTDTGGCYFLQKNVLNIQVCNVETAMHVPSFARIGIRKFSHEPVKDHFFVNM